MNSIVDFSYLEEMAEGKTEFTKQVLTIFMENTPDALVVLQTMINEGADFDQISRQAHFLKSSFGIVKVTGIHEKLQELETNARTSKQRKIIQKLMEEISEIYKEAEPIIIKKMEQV